MNKIEEGEDVKLELRQLTTKALTFCIFPLIVPFVRKHFPNIIMPMMIIKSIENSPHAARENTFWLIIIPVS